MTGPDSPARAPVPDAEALAWLDSEDGTSEGPSADFDLFTRDAVLEAFVAGREAAKAVDVPSAGVDLLREAAALFRKYEGHHRAKARDGLHNADLVAASLEKAEVNAAFAARVEAFLARPGPSLESYKLAWEQLSRPLEWMQTHGRLLPARCLGLNLAQVANVLIADAFPQLAIVIRAQEQETEDEGCPVSDPGGAGRRQAQDAGLIPVVRTRPKGDSQ